MYLAVQGCGVLSVNANLLLAAFRADHSDKKGGFQFLARCLGGQNAEPNSHLIVASAFADLAFQVLPSLEAQSATSHVLRALVRLNGIATDQIVEAFTVRCGDDRVRRYAREWTRGHFLHCNPTTTE